MLHYSAQLANALAGRKDMEVSVVLPRGARTDLFSDRVGCTFVDVVTGRQWRETLKGFWHLLNIGKFFRAVRATRPDIVHINSSHPWILAGVRRLAALYPTVATVHDVDVHPGEVSLRKSLERAAVTRYAHKLVVHRERLRQRLLCKNPRLSENDVAVTPHGDYGFFEQWTRPTQREPATVLFFGRIHAYKGLEHLIEAAPRIRAAVPGARFVIAGEGDVRLYRSALSDTDLFEVHNHYIPDEAVAELFQRAALLALPYIEASESGVLKIAVGFDLPVVASAVGSLPDAIDHDRTGLLVPPGDKDALANAIIGLLKDEDRRNSLAWNARGKASDDESWESAAGKLVALYGSLRNGH